MPTLSASEFAAHGNMVALDDGQWSYHAGHDSAWSDPGYDDGAWPLRAPRFRLEDLSDASVSPAGWYRRHIRLDSTVLSRPLYATIGSYGAVEAYWDGTLVYSVGKVSEDPGAERVLYREYSVPIYLETSGAADHVLAVRLTHHRLADIGPQATAGFRAVLQLGSEQGPAAVQDRDLKAGGWSVVIGLSLALMLLHLIVYTLSPQIKENLYFGLFAGGALLLSYTILNLFVLRTLSVEQFALLLALYRAAMVYVVLTAMRFMHVVSGIVDPARPPWRFFLLLGAAVTVAVIGTERIAYAIVLIVLAEVTRALVLAVRRKVERIWLIAVGLGALVFVGALVALVNLRVIEPTWWMEYVSIAALAALMLGMSVYIGAKYAATNRSLGTKIEETRSAVRALAESEDRYRSMVENPLAGVGIADEAGHLLFANQRYVDILGCTPDDILGRDMREPVCPEDREGVDEKLAVLLRGEAPMVTHEFGIQTVDGRRRTLVCSASTYRTRKGQTHLVIHSADVTEAREAERRRQEALGLAEQTARMASIGVMAGGITHEINQPLNAIMLHAETLQYMARAGRLDRVEPVNEALHSIVSGTERISEIVQHMRAYWVSAPGGELKAVDLNASVQQGVQLTGQKIHAHAVQLRLELASGPLLVPADPLQLEQVTINLLTNAVNALDKIRRPDKAVTVRTRREGSEAVIEVIDNGPGLPPIDPARLFDPLFSTGKEKGGTGLGLAIVQMFVERHKGTIAAENNAQGGATFRVRLPLETEVK